MTKNDPVIKVHHLTGDKHNLYCVYICLDDRHNCQALPLSHLRIVDVQDIDAVSV